MKRLILMLQFMTRIPIPIRLEFKNTDLGKGNVYFPLIGGIIGLFLVGIYWGTGKLFGSTLQALLTLAAYIWITGGLHFDGLSDTCDGLWSNRPKERMLEIMKDSRIGAFGVIGLLMTLFMNVAAIESLGGEWRWLILAPLLARYGCVFGNTVSRYARPDGMGKHFVIDCGWREFLLASLYTVPLTFILGGMYGLLILLPLIAFTYLFTRWVQKKIDGITGDIIGAVIELNHLLVLLLGIIYIRLY